MVSGRRRRGRQDGGFTLIETLIALVVAAGALALLQQGLGAGWKGLGVVRGERGALEVAQARLTLVGVEAPVVEGTSTGTTHDGYAWRVVAVRAPEYATVRVRPKLAGYWITATVTWRTAAGLTAERSLSLSTFKLGGAPP